MDPLKIYNSLSGKVEEFHPVNKPFLIGLYTCGPTVYSFTHIGHLRTYVFEDVLKKLLIQNGFLVEHVMNTTDVGHLTSDSDTGEDKMEKQAKKENKNIYQIASFYTKDFIWNLKKVNISLPNILAPASHHIKEQIEMIKKLEQKGYTYKTSDGIYFDTSKIEDYKSIFNQNKTDLRSDERIENILNKKNATDFAL
jgi:cysteinyl-tRNA synthetase